MTRKQIEEAKATLPNFWRLREQGIEPTEEQKTLSEELRCREMINSVLCYHNIQYAEEILDNRYVKERINELGENRVLELCKEQFDDFQKATVLQNVHTDGEGVSYNSIVWADERESEKDLNKYGDVWISTSPDVGENEGGLFCQVYIDENMRGEVDSFHLTPEMCDCTNEKAVKAFLECYAENDMYSGYLRKFDKIDDMIASMHNESPKKPNKVDIERD